MFSFLSIWKTCTNPVDQGLPEITNRNENDKKEIKYLDIINLPIDVFHVIRLYLKPKEFLQLLNANKAQFSKLKYHTINYPLTGYYSSQYLENIAFREALTAKLFSKSKQLSLTLFGKLGPYVPIHTNNLHRLHLSTGGLELKDILSIHNVHTLILNGRCTIDTFPKLHNIHTLILHGFHHLTDISNLSEVSCVHLHECNHLEDITPLENCTKLYFRQLSRLTNINCLGKQKVLHIIDCFRVVHVNHLRTVEELVLEDCQGITNIDELGQIPRLTISLRYLHHYPPRFSNRRLQIDLRGQIDKCENIYFDDIEIFTIQRFSHLCLPKKLSECATKYLQIINARGVNLLIPSLNMTRLFQLELSLCDVTDISMLGNIPVLILSSLEGIKSIDGLGKEQQRRVAIANCHDITSFRPLLSVPRVEIVNCNGFTSLFDLSQAQAIIVRLCTNLGNCTFTLPATVRYLQLNMCRNITSLYGMEYIEELEVLDCSNLSYISTLGSYHQQSIYFSKCPKVTTIKHLSKIRQVKIQNCFGIKDLHFLSPQKNLIVAPNLGSPE